MGFGTQLKRKNYSQHIRNHFVLMMIEVSKRLRTDYQHRPTYWVYQFFSLEQSHSKFRLTEKYEFSQDMKSIGGCESRFSLTLFVGMPFIRDSGGFRSPNVDKR